MTSRLPPQLGLLLGKALCAFVVFGATSVVVAMLLLSGVDPAAHRDATIERQIAAQLVGCLFLLCLVAFAPPLVGWRIDRKGALHALLAYACVLPLWFLFVVGWVWALGMLGHPPQPQEHLDYFARPHRLMPFLVVLLTVCVVQPIAEEALFRGYLTDALEALFGTRLGNLACAALFGVVHGLDKGLPAVVERAPALFLLGLLFARLRQLGGSLAWPALAHILHNMVMVGLVTFDPRGFDNLLRR